ALTTRIKQARRLVGDDGLSQSTIRTVRGRGFRFLGEVTVAADAVERDVPSRLPRELDLERTHAFVGRVSELQQAGSLLARPASAGTAWILLLGEPGIGKSRLAARLAEVASRQHDALVWFGRCSEDLAVPYQPIIEALRTATAGCDGHELRRSLGVGAHELARLIPDLAKQLPDGPEAEATDPETGRYRLFEAVNGWLDSTATDRPVLLVIDDAQWATESTLHLLSHLVHNAQAARLTVLLTARDTAPDLRPSLRDLIDLVESQPGNSVIRLGGLDIEAARTLLDDRPDVESIVEQTAGNPLLIQALVGAEDGSVDVDTAVRRRMARLAHPVRDTLVVAALVGLEFDVKVLARSLDRDELAVIDDLDQAVGARLLEDIGFDTFRFAHALVRASLRNAMSSPRRARWHGRIAVALELVYAGRLDEVAPAVAHHYAEASAANPSLRPVAVHHLRNAARRACEQLSFLEAAELLRRARSLAASTDFGLQSALAIEQGEAESSAGLNVAAMASFDIALLLARQAERPDLLAEAALRYEDASWRPGRFGGPSIERLTAALPLVAPGDLVTRARLLIALTRAYSMGDDFNRAAAAFAGAQEIIEELADPVLELRALCARYSSYSDAISEPPLKAVERLRHLCDRVDNVEVTLLGRQIYMRSMLRIGRIDEYRQGLDDMTTATRSIHSSFWDYIRANHEAMHVLYQGDLVAAEQASARCAEVASRLADDDTSGTLGLRMFVIRREQDRLRHLAPLIRQLVASGSTETFWTPGLALLLSELGYRDEAAAMLREFRDQGFDLPADAMWSTVMTMLIELAVALDDRDSCRLLEPRFRDQQGHAIVTGHGILCLGSGDRYLGMLAAALGELDRADDHFARASEFDDRNGGILWASHARLRRSEVWRRQGRSAEAADLRAEVQAVARRNGYAALERLASV
ncbi:MAG: transcriptional regulator, LuxR family, partial [Acidimicrobiia bacterium]|nr:transcriptional regulator, LuxR family [Acidimicrobiia bacterium]